MSREDQKYNEWLTETFGSPVDEMLARRGGEVKDPEKPEDDCRDQK